MLSFVSPQNLQKLLISAASFLLAGCGTGYVPGALTPAAPPVMQKETAVLRELRSIPDPVQPIYVTSYSFNDLTGQHKSNDNFAEFSRAVTQGGGAILSNALKEAGDGSWFKVLERQDLNALLQERQMIRSNREQFLGEDGRPLPPLRGLYNAGVLLSGGIVSYDANVATGGVGARYLGIGGDVQYRRDIVTVYLRATSVRTGENILSVEASKAIYSILGRGSVFKFIALDELLEAEGGVSVNEPTQVAVKQAIEKAVHLLIMEGAEKGYWSFGDPASGELVLAEYRDEKRKRRKGRYRLLGEQVQ